MPYDGDPQASLRSKPLPYRHPAHFAENVKGDSNSIARTTYSMTSTSTAQQHIHLTNTLPHQLDELPLTTSFIYTHFLKQLMCALQSGRFGLAGLCPRKWLWAAGALGSSSWDHWDSERMKLRSVTL